MGRNQANDASDAFRHAYWSFRMAQLVGPENAKLIGDGHEVRPKVWYEKFSLAVSGQKPGELLMDLFNNHMGRQLFLETQRSGTSNLVQVEKNSP